MPTKYTNPINKRTGFIFTTINIILCWCYGPLSLVVYGYIFFDEYLWIYLAKKERGHPTKVTESVGYVGGLDLTAAHLCANHL